MTIHPEAVEAACKAYINTQDGIPESMTAALEAAAPFIRMQMVADVLTVFDQAAQRGEDCMEGETSKMLASALFASVRRDLCALIPAETKEAPK